MPEQRYPQPFAIRQLCTAGQQFTGAAPGTTPTWDGSVYAFPTSASAGLIDPSAITFVDRGGLALRVEQVCLNLSGDPGETWAVYHVDGAGNETLWISGTTETDVWYSHPDTPRLLAGEKLKVVTTGATGAQVVQATFAPWEV